MLRFSSSAVLLSGAVVDGIRVVKPSSEARNAETDAALVALETDSLSLQYIQGDYGAAECPRGSRKATYGECLGAKTFFGLRGILIENEVRSAPGCMYSSEDNSIWYNENDGAVGGQARRPICVDESEGAPPAPTPVNWETHVAQPDEPCVIWGGITLQCVPDYSCQEVHPFLYTCQSIDGPPPSPATEAPTEPPIDGPPPSPATEAPTEPPTPPEGTHQACYMMGQVSECPEGYFCSAESPSVHICRPLDEAASPEPTAPPSAPEARRRKPRGDKSMV